MSYLDYCGHAGEPPWGVSGTDLARSSGEGVGGTQGDLAAPACNGCRYNESANQPSGTLFGWCCFMWGRAKTKSVSARVVGTIAPGEIGTVRIYARRGQGSVCVFIISSGLRRKMLVITVIEATHT